MAGTPAQPYYPQVDKSVDPKVTVHLQRIYPALNDHDKAITTLSAQFNSLLSSLKYTVKGTQVTAPASSSSSSSTTGVTAAQAQTIASNQIAAQFPTELQTNLGPVNNQTGTAYTVQQSDYGGIITINNAAAVAVTLNNGMSSSINSQWWASIENLGAGTATLTPLQGTVNGVANITLSQNQGALVYFDGANFWALTSPSLSAGAVTSLNGETGAVVIGSAGGTIDVTEPTTSTINLEVDPTKVVTSLQTEVGAITLTSTGATVAITTPTSSTINLEATGGGGGSPLAGSGTITITSGSFSSTTITVTGATTAMYAVPVLAPATYSPGTIPTFVMTAAVTSANTVTVQAFGVGGGAPTTYAISVLVFT